MKIAVIPATYNRPDALAALLEGYLAQDDGNFEIPGITNIAGASECRAAARFYLAGGRLELFKGPAEQCDPCPTRCKRESNALAHTLPRARNQRDLAIQR